MSRSSDSQGSLNRRALILSGVLSGGGLLLGWMGSATARAEVTGTPEPFDLTKAHPRVQKIEPRTSRINTRVEDPGGVATETTSDTSYDVRLHASVSFAKDSAKLLPAAITRLQQVAAQLQQRGPGEVVITGYTDDLGTEEHGLVLSRQRAEAVRGVLAPKLGSGYRFTVTGKGEADPLVPNTSEENRAQNRRVEIHFEKG